MSQLDKIKISLEGIGQLLKVNKLEVPKYQRDYAWEEKHVEDFFGDVSNAIRNNEPEYFVGSIVVKTNQTGRAEVVDGQQRLATTTILINAIKDIFEEQKDDKRATQISNDYIMSRDLRTEEVVPHLILNQTDRDYFTKTILGDAGSSRTTKLKLSHSKLLCAKQILSEKIKTIFSASNNDYEVLIDWIEYLSQKVRVIWVEVPDYSNAFTIFETLNDRGLDLAISDLLKNYLFHKSGNSIEKTQQNWLSMASVLEAAEDESIIVPYIKYLWSSFNGNVREKELYNEIKNKLKSKQSATDFANNLATNSTLYVAILFSDHNYWSSYSDATRDNIKTINLLGMVQVRPILLSILTSFNKKEIENSIKSLVSIIVRLLVTGTLSSGVFERQFSISAMKVRENEITNIKELISSLKPILPGDKSFGEGFEKFNVSKSTLSKYLLSTLENHMRNNTGAELVPNTDASIVNLEHILPKTLTDDWSQFSEEDHKTYVKRLGNQTLLSAKSNSKLGNMSYFDKKNVYDKSDFLITKSISDTYKNWTVEDIQKRQNKFAEIALKCWPLDLKT